MLACLPTLRRGPTPVTTVRKHPRDSFSEAINLLRHGLIPATVAGRATVVLVTSTRADEGKTGIAGALAQSAMQASLRVLLVDADFRRMCASGLFGNSQDPGLAEILRGGKDPELFDDVPEEPLLDVIPAGLAIAGTSGLLNSPAMNRFIALGRENYDLIVMDVPPVANLADAGLLADPSDRIAFVVNWKTTPRDLARAALRRLGGSEKCSLVLNAVDIAEIAQYGEIYGFDSSVVGQLPPPPPYFAVLALLALAAFSTRLVTGVQAFAARHYVWLLPQSLYVGVLCMSLIGSPGQGIAFRQIFFLSSFIMVAAAFAATSSNARTMRHLGAVALISFVAVTELLAHRVGQSWTMAIPRFLTTGDLDYNIYDFFRATFNAIDDPGNVQVSAGEKNALSVAVLTAGVMFRMGAPEGRAARAAPGCQNRYSPSRLPSLKTAI